MPFRVVSEAHGPEHFRKNRSLTIKEMNLRSRLLTAGMVLTILWGAGLARCAAPEYELKAAFVYNFAKFVEWPPGALSPTENRLVLGILAQDPERQAFEALAGRKVQNRTLVVQKGGVSELKNCQLVFISAGASRFLGQVLGALRDLPVLTITDEVEDRGSQGIINLVTSGGRVRFQVDMRQARRLGFKISSQLLKLAIYVND